MGADEKWCWLHPAVVLAMHEEHLSEHGGLPGLRDKGALEAALARPRNRAAYEDADIADLAAAYAWGIVRNHPFHDGNKRTGLLAMELFLALNGCTLLADDAACVTTFMRIAAGELGEEELAAWVRRHISDQPE